MFKSSAAAGTEPRLVIDGRAAAVPAYGRPLLNYRPAAVAELCQFIGNYRAAPGTDRECRFFLFRYDSAAPVTELCLVIESRVAAYPTGFWHNLLLVDKTGRGINTVMRFLLPYKPDLFRGLSMEKNICFFLEHQVFCSGENLV
jgi:hypothetical protein